MRTKALTLAMTLAAITSVSTASAQTAPVVDCAADFTKYDTNGDGWLTEAEAPSAYARARIDGTTIATEGLNADTYAAICGADQWKAQTIDDGAPLEGANSFTEEQAKDRAVSWSYSDISALTKDDKGIWRGTAKQGDAAVNIAIDYKGNVVATPQ